MFAYLKIPDILKQDFVQSLAHFSRTIALSFSEVSNLMGMPGTIENYSNLLLY